MTKQPKGFLDRVLGHGLYKPEMDPSSPEFLRELAEEGLRRSAPKWDPATPTVTRLRLMPLNAAPEETVLYVWARGGRVQFCLPLDRSQLFVRRMQVKDYIEPAGWIPTPEIEE